MPGEFDFFNEEPAAKPKPKAPAREERRPRAEPEDDYEDEPRARSGSRRSSRDDRDDRDPAPRKGLSPLAIGAIIGGAILLLAGGVVGIVLAVTSKPTQPKDKGSTATATKPAVTTPARTEPVDLTTPSEEVKSKVRKATVKILVQFAGKKGGGTGSGFVEKESRLVLTNAHVVGMKSMSDPQPIINLVCNSGVGDTEYRLYGEVAAIDAENDLAIIRPKILEVGKRTPVPDGLVVPKTSSVTELQRLFVFGFPLGDALGSEISIRPTQVTSLRHQGGKLNKIQVEGGMTFGNSGGPVVDVKGNVVGVAVSGIAGQNINFCVPGEMVQQLLEKERNR